MLILKFHLACFKSFIKFIIILFKFFIITMIIKIINCVFIKNTFIKPLINVVNKLLLDLDSVN